MKSILALLIILLLGVSCRGKKEDGMPQQTDTAAHIHPMDSLGMVIARIRLQSKLYTEECRVHKIVLYSDDTKLGGKLLDVSLPGHRKIAIPIDVTLKACVDFSGFSQNNVEHTDSLLILTLPDPQVSITASKVDYAGVRQYVSLTRSNFSDEEIIRLARQGEDSIARHVKELGIIEAARTDATRILLPLLQKTGFAEGNIIVRFRKDFDANDYRKMVRRLNVDKS